MTWPSHVAIASAIAMPFAPELIPLAALGATAPDWSEYLLGFFGHRITHRSTTHYLYVPIVIIAFSLLIFDFKHFFLWFGIGYLSHWFADALTPSGVPISQYNKYRVHIFGGKIKTGSILEYILSFGLLIFMANIINPISNFTHKESFNPYYTDYKKLFHEGIIDQKTMKENKYKIF